MKYKENIIKWNLEKYNYTKELYNKLQVQLFMENANTHLISRFKDYLFYDDFTEFFSKFYNLREALDILIPLLKYYEKSSYIFPNYTILHEGKYIYKNIIKKQILINYLENLELKKKHNIMKYNSNVNKNKIKNNFEKIFDTQLYNNILMNNNNDSNLNILFGIKINKNKDKDKNINNNNCEEISKDKDDKEDSIYTFKKIINAISESNTKSVGTNTINLLAFDKKKTKKGKKRNNNLSPKVINNSTNNTSHISNTKLNIISMFKINKRINHNNTNNISKGNIYNSRYPFITFEKNNNNSDSYNNSNLNFYVNKNLIKNKTHKNSIQKKTNSFLTYFNTSFMKSFLTKLRKKKSTTSYKSILNAMKTKNKINKTRKRVLTPIEKVKHHISICTFVLKNSKIKKYLTNIPSTETSSKKNNIKYRKIKVKNMTNNKILNNHTCLKNKIYENKNKGVLFKDNYLNYHHHHQRNHIFNLNTYSISLNNSSVYKTMNLNNMKKSIIPLTQYRKDKKISLCNEIFKNDNSIITKKKYFTNNISKTKLITNINNTEEDKKKIKKKKDLNKIYFKTKLPSPLKKGNLLNNHCNSLNKNKSLFKVFKTFHHMNIKNFPKKNISEFYKK